MRLSPELEAKCLALAVKVGGAEPAPKLPEFANESEFQAAFVKLAKRLGWECYHTKDSRRSEPGFPDNVLLREHGDKVRQVVVELKMPGKKPTAAQRKWLRLFEKAGAEVFTFWPYDWAEIERVLA